MKDFLNSIRTRFGNEAAFITELWLNFYIFGAHHDVDESYSGLVKLQMNAALQHVKVVNAKLFAKLIKESNEFLEKHAHTIH